MFKPYLFAPRAVVKCLVVASLPWFGVAYAVELPTELPKPTEEEAEARAAELVAQMTLEEKIALVSGQSDSRYDHLAIDRLGIPPLLACDAGLGVRTSYLYEAGMETTSFQSGLSLAATFNPEAAEAQGRAMGIEAYLLGYGSILGPVADAARTPYYGRNFEGLGEDPLLAGKMAAAQTNGQQESPVITSVKHFTGNVQEWNRHNIDELIDERALREYYARAWEILIAESAPGGIMAAFNSVNGEHCVDNYHLLTEILKEDLGHKGYVQSDFNGTTSVTNANAGLDFEGPDTAYFGDSLVYAIDDGTVALERLDNMVYRWLRSLIVSGYFDNVPDNALVALADRTPLTDAMLEEHGELAYLNALEGVVLLKNDDEALPLDSSVETVALIGADLDINVSGGGSASVPIPGNLVTVVDGIVARAADSGAEVEWIAGVDSFSPADTLGGPATIVPSSAFRPFDGEEGEEGLTEYVFGSPVGHTPLVAESIQPVVNRATGIPHMFPKSFANRTTLFPYNFAPHSMMWLGKFIPPATGTYTLHLHHMGGARLVIDAEVLIAESAELPTTHSVDIDLVGGQEYDLEINYFMDAPAQIQNGAGGMFSDGGIAKIRFAWTPPEGVLPTNIQEAVAAAESADVAVVFARDFNTESMDRQSLQLQQDQDRLISAVAAVNPRTVVVLQTGGPVLMPWLDEVEAVVEAWYMGQEQGDVIASILYGDANPSGKLPMTFPRSEEEQIANTAEKRLGTPIDPYIGWGDVPVNDFSEGIYVGYRGYDEAGIEPLFPFGYGLSYTEFAYSRLNRKPGSIEPDKWIDAASSSGGRIVVSFRVTNTGDRAGAEVAQVYLKFPDDVDMPQKQLVAFQRVELNAGQSKIVRVVLDPQSAARPLSMWSEEEGDWVIPTGRYTLMVGGSSADLPLSKHFRVR